VWLPIGFILLAAINIARVRSSVELDGNMKNMQTMATEAIAFLLILLWFIFLSRFRWRTRLIGLATVILLGVGAGATLRFNGSVDGSGTPRIAWKWAAKKSGEVTGVTEAKATADVKERPTDYPGYLGKDRRGVVENVSLERDWSGHPPQQLWRHDVGLGWSGFATVGSCAITQEQRGDQEMTVCYELSSGQSLWSHSNPVRFTEPMGGDGPRATPTIQEGRVYVLGGTGILDCLDAATGKLVWSRDTLKEKNLPNVVFGKASSPLICDDLVVVTGGMANNCSLLAFHRNDGSPAWQAGDDKAGYSSPMLATLAGVRQIVSINATTVTAHDPKDGHLLWQYAWSNDQWPKCAQPVAIGEDRLLIAASFNAGTVLLHVSPGQNGSLSVAEVWKNRNLKSEFSNIVFRDGFIYGLDDGIMVCLDAADGRRKWKGGHYGHGQVLLAGNLLVVQTEQGPVMLVEADPSAFHEIGKLDALTLKTWNTPALSGDLLLVRNDQEAACYRLPMAK